MLKAPRCVYCDKEAVIISIKELSNRFCEVHKDEYMNKNYPEHYVHIDLKRAEFQNLLDLVKDKKTMITNHILKTSKKFMKVLGQTCNEELNTLNTKLKSIKSKIKVFYNPAEIEETINSLQYYTTKDFIEEYHYKILENLKDFMVMYIQKAFPEDLKNDSVKNKKLPKIKANKENCRKIDKGSQSENLIKEKESQTERLMQDFEMHTGEGFLITPSVKICEAQNEGDKSSIEDSKIETECSQSKYGNNSKNVNIQRSSPTYSDSNTTKMKYEETLKKENINFRVRNNSGRPIPTQSIVLEYKHSKFTKPNTAIPVTKNNRHFQNKKIG